MQSIGETLWQLNDVCFLVRQCSAGLNFYWFIFCPKDLPDNFGCISQQHPIITDREIYISYVKIHSSVSPILCIPILLEKGIGVFTDTDTDTSYETLYYVSTHV